MSKTFYTFGAPDPENLNFKGAYSISLVDEIFLNLSEKKWIKRVCYLHKKQGRCRF